MASVESFALSGLEIAKLFKKLYSLEGPRPAAIRKEPQEWMKPRFEAEADRFELWAVNLGVFVSGHGSLDYRLREAGGMRDTLQRLINSLSIAINEVLQYLTEEHEPALETDEEAFDTDPEAESDIDLLLDGVKDPVDALFKLSVWIRNPVTRLVSSKAHRFQQIDPKTNQDLFQLFEAFDNDYISSLFLQYRKHAALQEKLTVDPLTEGKKRQSDSSKKGECKVIVWEPIRTLLSQHQDNLANDTEPFLVRRVAQANILRRRQFAYWKRHRDKLRQHTTAAIASVSRRNVPLAPLQVSGEARTDHIVPQVEFPVHSVTTATRLNIPTMAIDEKMSAASVSEYAPSSWQPGKEVFGFPPAPRIPACDKFFKCPYCFVLCPRAILSEKAWKAHMIHDLRPYICTYEQCQNAEQLYDSIKDWTQHENSTHRRIFRCPEHEERTFTTLEAYEAHIREEHDSSSSHLGSTLARQVGESTLSDAGRCCPICSLALETAQKLQSHIARHLERFSLFSLPRSVGDDDDDAAEAGSANVNLDSDGSMIDTLSVDLTFTDDVSSLAPSGHGGESDGDERTEYRMRYRRSEPDSDIADNGDCDDDDEEVVMSENMARVMQNIKMTHGSRDPEVVMKARKLADALHYRGKTKQAHNMYESRLKSYTTGETLDGPVVHMVLGALEDTYARNGYPGKVQQTHDRLFQICDRIWGPDDPSAIGMIQGIGRHYIPFAERNPSKEQGSEQDTGTKSDDAYMAGIREDAEELRSLFGETNPELIRTLTRAMEKVVQVGKTGDVEEAAGIWDSALLEGGRDANIVSSGQSLQQLLLLAKLRDHVVRRGGHSRPEAKYEQALRHPAASEPENLNIKTSVMLSLRRIYTGRFERTDASAPWEEVMLDWGELGRDIIFGQRKDLLEAMLKRGVDADEKDLDGRPLICTASDQGYLDFVKLLVKHGANVDLVDNNGRTALIYAAMHGHVQLGRFLVAEGANPNSADNQGATPMSCAARAGDEKFVLFLIAALADIDRSSGDDIPLVLAAGSGHEGIVELLLRNGADIEATDFGDMTALLEAAELGRERVAELLIEKGANIEAETDDLLTPLIIAAGENHTQVVQLLLEKGANINAKNQFQATALICAAEKGQEEVVELLVANGADTEAENESGDTPLLTAVREENPTVADILVRGHANVHTKNKAQETPLIWAAKRGDKYLIDLLIQFGATVDVQEGVGVGDIPDQAHLDSARLVVETGETGANMQARNKFQPTALLSAAQEGHEAAVRVLVGHGANMEVQDSAGKTPLLHALEKGYKGIVKLLLQLGADPNKCNFFGESPLYLAVVESNIESTKLLVETGAFLENNDQQGYTALALAARSGNDAMVGLLLDNGANIETTTKADKTPLFLAADHDRFGTVGLLVARGANLEARDSIGQTALFRAATRGKEPMTRRLIQMGANTQATDGAAMTPLLIALAEKHKGIISILLGENMEPVSQGYTECTSLVDAVRQGTIEQVRALLDNGADIMAKSKTGHTPLLIAAVLSRADVIELLLDRVGSADIIELLVDKVDHGKFEKLDLKEALDRAVQGRHWEIVEFLLDKGADPDYKASEGESALLWATKYSFLPLMTLLVSKGADANAPDGNGMTPLRMAAKGRDLESLRLMISHDADLEWAPPGDVGETALAMSVKDGDEFAAKFLLQHGADRNPMGQDGRSLIDWAVEHGKDEMAGLLRSWPPGWEDGAAFHDPVSYPT